MRHPTSLSAARQAAILCTRNRADDLRITLESVAAAADRPAHVLVIDASDPEHRPTVAASCEAFGARHVPFEGRPSLARQRNHALDVLPDSVEIVHFLDDDVTLAPHYFDALAARFASDPSVGGVGARVDQDEVASAEAGLLKRFFLLAHPHPGRVLVSGRTTPAQLVELDAPTDVEWLSGCAFSFRRDLVQRLRFDDRLDGYSLDEDLDLSYRLGLRARLVVEPAARLRHRVSPQNRDGIERGACDAMVHRYWFVRKNLPGLMPRAAFWWAALGRLGALAVSASPHARAAMRGTLRGLARVAARRHPLLSAPVA